MSFQEELLVTEVKEDIRNKRKENFVKLEDI